MQNENPQPQAQQEEQVTPNVARFERAVREKDYERACNTLLSILGKLDENFGGLQGIEFAYPDQYRDKNMEMELTVYF